MKKFIFLTFLLASTICYSQDSIPSVAPVTLSTNQAKVLSKADSFMVTVASKQGIDTNATAEELGQRIDEATKLVPGKHAGPVKWLTFIMFLIGTLTMAYFFVKHGIVKAYKGFTGASIIIALFALNSCATIPTLFSNAQSYVEKHCPSDTIKNPLTGNITINWHCDSLWNAQAIKAKCPTANLCVDIANAAFTANLSCPNVVPSVSSLIATKKK